MKQCIITATAVKSPTGLQFPEINAMIDKGWLVKHIAPLTVPGEYYPDNGRSFDPDPVPTSTMVFVLERPSTTAELVAAAVSLETVATRN